MPTKRQADPSRALNTDAVTDAVDSQIEAKPTKLYGRANPDFAAMAGWRAGFGSPYHKTHIVRTLKNTSALCPGCRFDLINQRRPDCPKCGLAIDLDAVIIQTDPPGKPLTGSLVAAVACSWIAMIAGGFAWAGATKAIALTGLFALQLAAGWLLLTLATDLNWYRGVSTRNRRVLLAGAISAAGIAGATAVAAIADLL